MAALFATDGRIYGGSGYNIGVMHERWSIEKAHNVCAYLLQAHFPPKSSQYGTLRPTAQGSNLSLQLRPVQSNGRPQSAANKIADFTNPGNLDSTGKKSFTLPANTELAANTEYFVFISFSGNEADGPRVELTASDGEDSGALTGWSIANQRYQHDGGWGTNTNAIKIAVHATERASPAPSVPRNFTATREASGVRLRWGPPAGDVPILQYEVRRRESGSSWSSWRVISSTTRTIVIRALADGVAHEFQIRAATPAVGPVATATATPDHEAGIEAVCGAANSSAANSIAHLQVQLLQVSCESHERHVIAWADGIITDQELAELQALALKFNEIFDELPCWPWALYQFYDVVGNLQFISKDLDCRMGMVLKDGSTVPISNPLTPTHGPGAGSLEITGTARVGETLTADISGITNANGLDSATFDYQWIANDGATDTDIDGATDESYTLTAAEAGKTIRVRVTFIDDRWTQVSLTSPATAVVNTPATGAPTISGTAQVSETLTADISGIADEDGLENATFTYQWRAGRKGIAGATGESYTLTDDEGKAVRVTVSFTDERGHEESLTSAATDAVVENDDYTMDDIFDAGSYGYLYVPGTHPDSSQPGWDGSLTGSIEEPGDVDFFVVELEQGKTYRFEVSGSGGATALASPRLSGVYLYLLEFECSGADDDPSVRAYALVAERSATYVVAVRADDDGVGEYTITVAETSETNTGCDTLQPGKAAPVNSPATGLPTISGTAQVGETLTADVSGIADEDGPDNASFSYQWAADGSDISGATDSTYTLADTDEGKAISVTVSFTDDAGNEESLTSAATAAVEARPNTPAIGLPTIGGTAQVGETLTADTSGISDDDGLTNATFSYQWAADGADISGATGSTYTLVDADEGTAISVTVSFTDDAGNEETLTSAPTAAVEAKPNTPATGLPTISGTAQVGETLTADTSGIADEDGLDNASFSYQWAADGSDISGATDSTYTLADADQGTAISVAVSFTDDAGNEETLTSAPTATVEAKPNTPATGLPTISGTAQVGETLTADTSGIADEDGLDNASFSYQWAADGADISGATGSTHTLADADEGAAISVTVSFTDDAGNEETLTSAATVAVEAKPNTPATGLPAISGDAQVGETLTVDTSGIADSNGLAGVSYSYQWISNDGNSDSDITGATGSTYTLVDDDLGKTIKVKVTFTDDADNDETLTSAATSSVAARPNSEATGAPTISGTVQVGETLTADTSGIADSDGLTNVSYSYQWISNDGNSDSDIAGTTNSTYTLVAADEGKTIKVKVTFTDDRGHGETLTSESTAAVAGLPPEPLTAVFENTPSVHDGESVFTFHLQFSEEFNLSYKTLRDRAFTVTGGTVKKAQRLEKGSNVGWRITVRPGSGSDVTIVLPETTDCDSQGAICTQDGRMLSNHNELTVSGPGG